MSNSLQPQGLYSPWDSPGQNTGVSSLSLLQRTFPTQGSNPGLPHCRRILYQPAEPQGKPIHGKPLVTYFSSKKQSWELWEDNFDLIKNGNHPITK